MESRFSRRRSAIAGLTLAATPTSSVEAAQPQAQLILSKRLTMFTSSILQLKRGQWYRDKP